MRFVIYASYVLEQSTSAERGEAFRDFIEYFRLTLRKHPSNRLTGTTAGS